MRGRRNLLTDGKPAGEIQLRLYSSLGRYGGEKTGSFPVAVKFGETVGDLIRRFKIPPAEISMVLKNDRRLAGWDVPLLPGDEVKIFGLMGGG